MKPQHRAGGRASQVPLVALLAAGVAGTARLRRQGRTERNCFTNVQPGEAELVRSVRLRHRNASYLIAQEPSSPAVGGRALDATLEALLGECDKQLTSGMDWMIDVGAGSGEVSAIASRLGCAVAAFDSKEKLVRNLEATACINDAGRPFVVFPAVAAAQTGRQRWQLSDAKGNGSSMLNKHQATGEVQGVALDNIFVEGQGARLASAVGTAVDAAKWDGEVALLKVTQQSCGDPSGNLWALQGAASLLGSGRVRCMMVQVDFSRQTMKGVLSVLGNLEHQGFRLAHPGPLDAPDIEILPDGTYPLYQTDARQLGEIFDNFDRVRRFDERQNLRAYSAGLSLDREGRYFDYSDLVFGCRGRFPERLKVLEKAQIKYKDGMWYPHRQAAGWVDPPAK